MKAAPFDYVEAGSADEAVQILAEAGNDATVLAGGQTLMPLLALRLANPSVLVDINPAEDMATIARRNGATVVGARTRQAHAKRDATVAERVPLMAEALNYVGHYQTRARGTIGGSVALGEPAAEMPALAVALNAAIELRSRRGTRMVPAREFYVGPYVTIRDDDELLVAIHYPDWPDGSVGIFHEVARRAGDFALVGLIAIIAGSGDRIDRAGVAWFGMGPTPIAALAAEQALIGALKSEVDVAALAQTALAEVEPNDDLHASARYRRTVAARIFERRLRPVFEARA